MSLHSPPQNLVGMSSVKTIELKKYFLSGNYDKFFSKLKKKLVKELEPVRIKSISSPMMVGVDL